MDEVNGTITVIFKFIKLEIYIRYKINKACSPLSHHHFFFFLNWIKNSKRDVELCRQAVINFAHARHMRNEQNSNSSFNKCPKATDGKICIHWMCDKMREDEELKKTVKCGKHKSPRRRRRCVSFHFNWFYFSKIKELNWIVRRGWWDG